MDNKFLFIVDPLSKLDVKTDTSLALIEESSSLGIRTFACELQDIFLQSDRAHFLAAEIRLEPGYRSPPSYLSGRQTYSVDDFSAVFMRKDPPIDQCYIAALHMLRCFDAQKTLMVNHPDGLLLANEKLFGHKIAGSYFSPTLVSSNKSLLEQFVDEHTKVVLKPLFDCGGAGVLVTERDDKNLSSMMEILSSYFTKPIIAQRYIEDAHLGDKRIILVGGEAKGAIKRMPKKGDHRANLSAGGAAYACDITKEEQEIITILKPELLNLGLHLVGIDVIAGCLTEINVTSPTGVLEIERTADEHPRLRAQIIDYVLQALKFTRKNDQYTSGKP